jgi:ADP-ribosylglycohydrolase
MFLGFRTLGRENQLSTYSQKFKGSLLAAALGDALGSFGECLHYKTVDRKYHTIPPRSGRSTIPYSDDTALRLVLYDTILSSGLNASNLAAKWGKSVVDNRVYWTSELYVTSMILMGEDPHRIGYGNMLGDNAAMAADPIGMLYPCLDELAALRAFETMSVCQSGKGLEGAMSVAAAVSESLSPESTLDAVVDASGRWVSKQLKRRIERAVSIASKPSDPRKTLYEELTVEDGLTVQIRNEINSPIPVESAKRLKRLHVTNGDISMGISPLEVVPIAMGYVARGRREPLKALIEAARFGRDCDTIAGISGAILGALYGVRFLPESYRRLLPRHLVARSNQMVPGMSRKARRIMKSNGLSSVAKVLFA